MAEAIRLGLGNFVELEPLERRSVAGQSEGDLRLGVIVHSDGFSGQYDQVWVAKTDWQRFISELTTLERVRTGGASLYAMSPDEFELHLQIIDRAGHLSARGFLSRYHFHAHRETSRSRIEYENNVDAGLLRQLVESFTAVTDVLA